MTRIDGMREHSNQCALTFNSRGILLKAQSASSGAEFDPELDRRLSLCCSVDPKNGHKSHTLYHQDLHTILYTERRDGQRDNFWKIGTVA